MRKVFFQAPRTTPFDQSALMLACAMNFFHRSCSVAMNVANSSAYGPPLWRHHHA